MSDMPIVPLSLTLLPLLLRNTDDIIETCLLCDGRNVIISITKSLPIIIQLMLPCCSILTKKCYKLIFMFLILCLNLTYTLGVIKIIQLIIILNTISQLCHFIPFWVPFLLIVMRIDTERNPGDNNLLTFWKFRKSLVERTWSSNNGDNPNQWNCNFWRNHVPK